jgi:tetratricopeptide (TPR) repeat protein
VPEPDGSKSVERGLQYEIADRTGTGSIRLVVDEIRTLIGQGRLARNDRVAVGGDWRTLGETKAFRTMFDAVSPTDTGSLSARPDVIGEGDTLALLEVFARLSQERQTGRLFVLHTEMGHERVIALREGVPIAAFSNVPEEWIGEQLLKKGLIDQGDYDTAVARRAKTNEPLGAVLVALGRISARDMKMAISVQALERLLNIFRVGKGTRFRFTRDPSAADEAVMVNARPREIIETAISTAMSSADVREVLESYTDSEIEVQVTDAMRLELTPGDDALLAILKERVTLQEALPRLARAAQLTEDEARVRLLALATFGAIALGGHVTRDLTRQLAALQRKSYFDMLDVRMGATESDLQVAHAKRRSDLGLDDDQRQVGAAGRMREQIGSLLDQAVNTLSHPFDRAVYARAQQMGVDINDPTARRIVELDEYMAIGHSALQTQTYGAARDAFAAAAERSKDDPRPWVQLGWARSLESGHTNPAAETAIREVGKALEMRPDFDVAYLYIGKIHRLAGNKQKAEDALRKAIKLNLDNVEAQSELRLMFARELGRKSRQLDVNFDGRVVWAAAAVVILTGALFFVSNLMSGGLKTWPDPAKRSTEQVATSAIRDTVEMVKLRLNHTEPQLIDAAKELGADDVRDKVGALAYLATYEIKDVREALISARRVPHHLQKVGNAEYFYFSDDGFWWGRRLALFAVGLLLIFVVGRRFDFAQSVTGNGMKWVWIAIPYGLAVGFLSGVLPVQASTGMLVGMTLMHVVAEQTFFSGFVNRALLKGIANPFIAIGVAGVLFGLYHVSYFAIFQQPAGDILVDAVRIGAFAGAAYAALLWLSGGLVAPFVAHLLVSGTMLLRSGMLS